MFDIIGQQRNTNSLHNEMHYTFTKMTKIKMTDNTKNVGQLEPSYTVNEIVK